MSDVKAKMHQIRFPNGKGNGREGMEGMGRERRGRDGREREWEHAPIGIFESRRLCPDLR